MVGPIEPFLRLRRDQRGIAAVTVAITLPLLFAFGALAIDSGLWLTIKRQNQSAADAAALSAAYELIAYSTDPDVNANHLTPAAQNAVTQNVSPGLSFPTITVTYPYT